MGGEGNRSPGAPRNGKGTQAPAARRPRSAGGGGLHGAGAPGAPSLPGRCLPRGGQMVSGSVPAAGTRGRRCSPPPGRGDPAPNAPRSLDLGVARSLLRAPLSACCKTQQQHSNRTVPERDPTATHPRPTPRAPRAAPSSGEPRRRPRPGAGARGAAGSRLCGTALVPRLRSHDSGKGGGAGVASRCLVGHGANR